MLNAISRGIAEETMIHPYNGIVSSYKKNEFMDLFSMKLYGVIFKTY